MTQVLDWHRSEDLQGVVRHTVQALANGQLVSFPMETVYGLAASGLVPAAVERLIACQPDATDRPLTLALRSSAEVADWVPRLSKLGQRLSRRCWPGPVTLVFREGMKAGLASRLHADVRKHIGLEDSIGLRVPAHEAIRQTLQYLPGPLVLRTVQATAEAKATTGREVLQTLGERIDLVIDDGPSRYGQVSSVVRVDEDRWELLREGVVPARTLERLSSCVILFICTGNTCRSPMAEGLCKKLLADRLGCTAAELPQRGFVVLSAGVSAMMGSGAAPEAIETTQARGVDLASHVSQPLTIQLLAQADYAFAMTQSHLRAAQARFPRGGCPVQVLSPRGDDLADPIGGDREVYEACASQIDQYLRERLSEMQP